MTWSKDIVAFNAHTSARDKIVRFLQYGSRLILWQMTYGSPEVKGELIEKLKKLEAALSLSRKLFRMGNSLDLIQKALAAMTMPNRALMVLTVTSHSFKAIWLMMDHLLWLGKVGMVKIDMTFWTRNSLRAWLVALIAAVTADIIKFEKTRISMEKFRKENGQGEPLPVPLKKEFRSIRMTFWRDFCDLFIPLGGLRYISPGIGALCGVASSSIGFVQEWEKHIRPL